MLSDNPYGDVSWDEPVATDNTDGKIGVIVYPFGTKPPWKCYNTTTVEYTATDPSGNKATCTFKVTLEGTILGLGLPVKCFSCNMIAY